MVKMNTAGLAVNGAAAALDSERTMTTTTGKGGQDDNDSAGNG